METLQEGFVVFHTFGGDNHFPTAQQLGRSSGLCVTLQAAFEPRPATSEHIKQQAGAAASGEADVRPPALSNSMYLQQQQQQQHSAVSAQTLDVFGKELLVHSHQLPPPVTPGKSGNTYYTVAPHQASVQANIGEGTQRRSQALYCCVPG